MKVSKELIGCYSEKGIEVKNYPGTLEEYRQQVWEQEYKWAYQYDSMMDIWEPETKSWRKLTHEELHAKATEWADSSVDRKVNDWYNSDTLYIAYPRENGDMRLVAQKVAGKGRVITPEYIDRLIAKDKKKFEGTFGKLADGFNKLILAAGFKNHYIVYPTTYGIGVWHIFNGDFQENCKDVEDILVRNLIDYETEYSDKRWIFRFKISKSQANVKLIETI